MKQILFSCLILLLFLGIACTEFLSQNVDELELKINSPVDSLYTRPDIVTFWWEDDRRVESYRFQLVSPNFDNPFVLLDTSLNEQMISVELTQGVYTWRLRAENEGSDSPWQVRQFVLDQTVPFGATTVYPRDRDTLFADDFREMLQWNSKDQPVDGFSFAVSDSVFLFSWKDSVLQSLAQYAFPLETSKQVDISGALPGVAPGDSNHYRWLVKTFDQAGNSKLSKTFEFTLWR